jgi:hypothetical protein
MYRKCGIINYYQRFKGYVHQELDLRRFPFDTQTLKIRFGAFLWGADQFQMVDYTELKMVSLWHHSALHALHEWTPAEHISLHTGLQYSIEDQVVVFLRLLQQPFT